MAIGKKGYFFTLSVVLLLALVAIAFSARNDPGYSRESLITSQRLQEIDRFISTVEQDASTALFIASFRSYLAIDEELLRNSGYVTDYDDRFEELVLNGTINGVEAELLATSTMDDWEEKLQRVAAQLRIAVTLSDLEVTSKQENPWDIIITMDGTLHIEDQATRSTWDQPIIVTTTVPIKHFFDPLYTVESQGRYFQRIQETPYDNFPDDLDDHIAGGYYIASNNSPSFLQRLSGDFGEDSTDIGIESLANVPKLQSVDINRPEGSIIDWHYLRSIAVPTCDLTPSWVRIAIDHTSYYAITNCE